MSSKWLPLVFKNNNKVYVNKSSWDGTNGLVEYKYGMTSTKTYKGSRSNFSISKTSKQNQQTIKKFTTKSTNKKIKYGKAGTRTAKQKKLVKEKFDELYASFGDYDIICFTDGACKGNPGPAGSGCVILYGKKNKNTIEKSIALGRYTNNIAELYAIGLGLHIMQCHPSSADWIQTLRDTNPENKIMIRILSDSRYSIGVLSKGWKAKKNVELITWIRNELSKVCNAKCIVTFHWVGGHSGIEYNELVDELANQGVAGVNSENQVDVKKPPKLFQSEHNENSLKRKKKRKLDELDEVNVANGGHETKRRRLNAEGNVNENTNVKETMSEVNEVSLSTPPQSPTVL